MELATFKHILPSGERITSTLLTGSPEEWAECPESCSPLWASCTLDGRVFALAVSAAGCRTERKSVDCRSRN